ncbi:MAG TPA: hypothetical protein VHU82_02270 [Vicinamibacterales bacterium]|nr:hypothetical protein [Vicinamibacterales bacterium]
MLRAIASGWLVCQLAGLSAAPISVWMGPVEVVASAGDDCCPGVAPGQVCPMHHTREGAKHCVMRGDCASPTAALLTLVGGLGLMPPHVRSLTDPLAANGRALLPAPTVIARDELPESPPPRA